MSTSSSGNFLYKDNIIKLFTDKNKCIGSYGSNFGKVGGGGRQEWGKENGGMFYLTIELLFLTFLDQEFRNLDHCEIHLRLMPLPKKCFLFVLLWKTTI